MEERQSAIPVELPPMGNTSPAEVATKSLTHWIWTPFRDINNMGPIELRSQLGYRDGRWTALRRCTPYPLGNLTSYEPDRAAAEGMSGYNLNSDILPKIEYVKYAQDQAKELTDTYQMDGMRILIPLVGMDNPELVGQIIQTVQPFEYDIHEMAFEFSEGAKKRINDSNLSDADKAKAFGVAQIMFNGSQIAEKRAQAEYEGLISSMSDKMAGGPGIANPSNAHQSHHWICKQVNRPVPERIDRTGGQGNQSDAINILANRALREETAAESAQAELAVERAARLELEAKVNLLLAAQEPKTGKQARP